MMTIADFRAKCMERFDARKDELHARAETNIEKYRKGDHTLQILDQNGQPAAGVRVHVKLKNHDFKHGANIFMLDCFQDPEINQRYRETFPQYFNMATLPFYWEGTEPEEGLLRYDIDSPWMNRRPPADLCMKFCEENNISTKVHCLYYDKMMPKWIREKDSETMWKLYEKRFSEISERYAGRMYEFEVSNETTSMCISTTSSVLSKERDVELKMWQLARRYFPNEKLVVHDAELCNVGIEGYQCPFYLTIENLLLKGATIDKIAVQNHVFMGVSGSQEKDLNTYLKHFDPKNLLRAVEVLASFGKPLEISEVTLPTFGEGEEAEQLQADILRILYTFWFATPEIENVVYWNIADQTAYSEPGWDENAIRGGLFHRDMTPKLSALELKRLFKEQWHTELDLVTDAEGKVSFRGFYGDYTADVENQTFNFGVHKNTADTTTCTKA